MKRPKIGSQSLLDIGINVRCVFLIKDSGGQHYKISAPDFFLIWSQVYIYASLNLE